MTDRSPQPKAAGIVLKETFMTDFTLRPWKMEDAPSVARVADNPFIAQNLRDVFPHPYTLADALEFVGSCVRSDGRGQLTRAIEINGEAAGSIGVFLGSDVYRRSAELGYWLAEPYWGQGVMTRAVRAVCAEAFERFDIVRIFAEPFAGNAGSRRVLEKAGFTYEGTMRNGAYKNGAVLSYCLYSLLREEL